MKTIFITGTSSGIGKAAAKHFAAQGWQVAATMRKPEQETELSQIEQVHLYPLDVTKREQIQASINRALQDLGHIDVVLNNAGYGLVGAFEAASPEQIYRQFNTNVFGLMEVTRAFLPHFRSRQAGLFINVSSLGGRITYPFSSLYHASKWAVEGFSESLAYELGALGIQVKLVEPGAVATDFGGRSMEFTPPHDFPDYGPIAQQFMAKMGESGRIPASAETIAEGIYEAATDGKQQLRYPLGDAAQVLGLRNQLGDDGFVQYMRAQLL